MQVTIQQASVSNAALLSELAVSAFYETYSAYNTPENMQHYIDNNFLKEHIETELQSDKMICFIAFANDKMVGYVSLEKFSSHNKFPSKFQIEIKRIYVLKAFQQLKIGWQLFSKAVSFSKEQNFDLLWLGVWEKNISAINFYKKAGMEIFDKHLFMLGNDAQTDYDMKLVLR